MTELIVVLLTLAGMPRSKGCVNFVFDTQQRGSASVFVRKTKKKKSFMRQIFHLDCENIKFRSDKSINREGKYNLSKL